MMDCAFSGGRRGGLRGLTRRRRRRFRGGQTQAAEGFRVAGGVTRATKRFVNSFTMIEAIRTGAIAKKAVAKYLFEKHPHRIVRGSISGGWDGRANHDP